jgi:hypothetical protein
MPPRQRLSAHPPGDRAGDPEDFQPAVLGQVERLAEMPYVLAVHDLGVVQEVPRPPLRRGRDLADERPERLEVRERHRPVDDERGRRQRPRSLQAEDEFGDAGGDVAGHGTVLRSSSDATPSETPRRGDGYQC